MFNTIIKEPFASIILDRLVLHIIVVIFRIDQPVPAPYEILFAAIVVTDDRATSLKRY